MDKKRKGDGDYDSDRENFNREPDYYLANEEKTRLLKRQSKTPLTTSEQTNLDALSWQMKREDDVINQTLANSLANSSIETDKGGRRKRRRSSRKRRTKRSSRRRRRGSRKRRH